MLHNFTFVSWAIACICFFIAWMNWSIPGPRPAPLPPRHPWNWTAGGFLFTLLPFIVAGVDFGVHVATRTPN